MGRRATWFMLMLPFSMLLFGSIWDGFAPGCLYHCWDDAPPLAISWFPPFVHADAATADGLLHDHFIWPAWSVYLVWFFLFAAMLAAPAMVALWSGAKFFGDGTHANQNR